MNDSIRRWNEENHVSEKISAALESVAQVTQHVFDSIFPSMSVVGETNGPVSDEVYATLPIASPVNASSEAPVDDMPAGDSASPAVTSTDVPLSAAPSVPLQTSSNTLQPIHASEPIHPMYEQHDPSRASEIDLTVFSNTSCPWEIHTKHCSSNN